MTAYSRIALLIMLAVADSCIYLPVISPPKQVHTLIGTPVYDIEYVLNGVYNNYVVSSGVTINFDTGTTNGTKSFFFNADYPMNLRFRVEDVFSSFSLGEQYPVSFATTLDKYGHRVSGKNGTVTFREITGVKEYNLEILFQFECDEPQQDYPISVTQGRIALFSIPGDQFRENLTGWTETKKD